MQSQVKFNRVPEKVPEKVPGRLGSGEGPREGSGEGRGRLWCRTRFWRGEASLQSWEALVQSQVRFNRVLEKVPEEVWEALVQSQVRCNRVPKKVPEKVLGGFGAEPGQVQQGSEEGSGEGLGGLVQPGQVQQGSGEEGLEKVPEKVREALSGSTGFQVWEALVQSQVRFNRVPEKVPGGFGVEPGQVQQGSGEFSGEGLLGLSTHGSQAEVYRGCFAARFKKTCKNPTFRLLGIPPKLIFMGKITILDSDITIFDSETIAFDGEITIFPIHPFHSETLSGSRDIHEHREPQSKFVEERPEGRVPPAGGSVKMYIMFEFRTCI